MSNKFKKGDKVKVVKKILKEHGWNNAWVSDMDKFIGHIYTVSSVDKFGVHFNSSNFGFPPSSLELIKNEK